MTTTFVRLGLPDPLVRALAGRGVTEPFPVQAVAIPDALGGRDVSGRAPTGSGKTLAFGLPVLARVGRANPLRPRALVLAPTRELAEQIKRELSPLAKAVHRIVLAVYGGVGYGPQKSALREGVDVLVATPGRLEDLINQGSVDLREADTVVVDEADRLADMGFLPAVRRILDRTPPHRQTLLFSATLDGDVAVLSRDYQRDPVRHEAAAVEPATKQARHHFWLVHHNDRAQHAADVVEAAGRSIVFTRTRHRADRLAEQIGKLGVGAVALHGGRTQNQRTRAMEIFASGRAQALVATDVAARGIHIDDVASVIHFDPPADAKDYLHRSGRTARAGAAGTVVSLITADQQRTVRRMQRDLDLRAPLEAPRLDAIHRGHDDASEAHCDQGRQESKRADGSQRPRRATIEPQSIYVANLPWATTEADLEALFGRHGRVHQTTIVTSRRTGRSRGFGFVDMPATAARDAVEALHQTTLGGRKLTVRVARPRRHGT
jgi:superfamily II DNA/RNA helicase